MSKHFQVIVTRNAVGTSFLAEVPDLEGCVASGETLAEAFTKVQAAIAAWIKTAQEAGRPVPEPRTEFFTPTPGSLN